MKKADIKSVGIRRADYTTPLYPQKLSLTPLTSGGRFVGIVRSWTQATEFVFWYSFLLEAEQTPGRSVADFEPATFRLIS
jgi:hypothetical protein